MVTLATASPYKFAQDVLNAIGVKEADPMQAMKKLEDYAHEKTPKGLAELNDLPILYKDVISIDDMKQDVANYIEELFHD